jgi:hypothetical protein
VSSFLRGIACCFRDPRDANLPRGLAALITSELPPTAKGTFHAQRSASQPARAAPAMEHRPRDEIKSCREHTSVSTSNRVRASPAAAAAQAALSRLTPYSDTRCRHVHTSAAMEDVVRAAAAEYNLHVVAVVDKVHQRYHPAFMLDAVKLLQRIIGDLQEFKGKTSADAMQPVRSDVPRASCVWG